jgi:protein-disulfide isomerase
MITRRAFTAALSLTGLAALAGLSPLRLISYAMAQGASDVAKPVSLPDMALGPADAYFAVIDMLFKQQNDWVSKNTTETLTRIGKQAGLSQQAVEACLKDQALLDKIAADQKFASDVLKVNSTPTFFVNGEMIKGETSFEEFDKKIKPLLKS